MKNIRYHYEEAVLGACLFDNAYPRIAHVLKPQNFAGVCKADHQITNQKLFAAIVSLHPERPIDLITVTDAYQEEHGNSTALASYLSQLMIRVNSTANVVYHAFAVLEMDVREKFLLKISEHLKTRTEEGNHVAVGVLKEILESLQMGKDFSYDLFDIIENTAAYFKQHHMEEESGMAQEFMTGLHTRIKAIKQVSQIELYSRNLMRATGNGGAVTRAPANKLVTALIELIIAGKLTTPSLQLADYSN